MQAVRSCCITVYPGSIQDQSIAGLLSSQIMTAPGQMRGIDAQIYGYGADHYARNKYYIHTYLFSLIFCFARYQSVFVSFH